MAIEITFIMSGWMRRIKKGGQRIWQPTLNIVVRYLLYIAVSIGSNSLFKLDSNQLWQK